MKGYEKKLGMIRRFHSLREAAGQLRAAADTAEDRDELAGIVREIADRILDSLS